MGSTPCTVHCAVLIGTISRKMVLLAALSNGQNPLGMSNTGAMKQLRGPKHENWPVCDPRAVPPGEYGLKSGENGHLARPNGAVDGPYCSPTCPSVCVRRCEPLAGAVVLRAELHQRPHAARGALLQFDWLRKNSRCPGPGARCPKAWAGWLSYAACSREGLEEQSNGLATIHKPCQMRKEKPIVTCASDQVVIAWPLVLTPPRRCRRSLASKGRVGIRSSLPKRRYCVAMDYVGGPL
jgi:hypothetical protein